MSVNKHVSTEVASVQENINESAIIRQVSFVSIIGNFILTAFKLFAGIVGHSSAMVSDSIHSLSDVISTLIAFWGVRMSKKAADKSHPYGHERIECVASLILGLLLMATGVGIGKVGLQTILSGEYDTLAVPGVIALTAAVVSIALKEAMFWYTRHYAKLLNSAAFMADAWHHRSDAFSSIGSLLGIGGAMLGFPVLDSVASVVICLCILKVAYDILKDALTKMLDTSCGEDYDRQLREYIAAQEDVIGVDVLRSRMFGNKVYVDLEIEMDGDKTLRESHAVAERIHDNVETDFPNVKHIMIHVNPAEPKQ
ncbi:cation diffusion facilitator family transporter [Butyricicoccus sp.]|uniref:cation diffusion facilitator family transporter n=1 Tax=Butyricicoccus sp. TaxID=2049021 RepID=UPI003F145102